MIKFGQTYYIKIYTQKIKNLNTYTKVGLQSLQCLDLWLLDLVEELTELWNNICINKRVVVFMKIFV